MSKQIKTYTLAEVKEHGPDAWMVINDSVYDLKSFLREHPGGEDVLLEVAGKDATVEFDDVGHSADAKEQMKAYKIGEIIESERKTKPKPAGCPGNLRFTAMAIGIAIVAIGANYLVYRLVRN